MITKTADTKYSVCPVAKIALRPKDGKDISKLINLSRKKQVCIYVNKMDCDNKQERFDEISNKMTSWREHPQPSEILERFLEMVRMTENDDD